MTSRHPDPLEGTTVLASELGEHLHGYLIRIPADSWLGYRSVWLGGVRRWVNADGPQMEVLDLGSRGGNVRGTAYRVDPAATVKLERRLARTPKPLRPTKTRAGDYAGPLSST